MGVRNYLVDGVSGSGKTAVCHELRRRGHHAVNGDRELAYQGNPATGEPTAGVTGLAVHDHHLWRVADVAAIVSDRSRPISVLCGGSRNSSAFRHLFDEVFVLVVDGATLTSRLDARSADEWGGEGREAERALVHRLHETGEGVPTGATQIDAGAPLSVVVDEILRRIGP